MSKPETNQTTGMSYIKLGIAMAKVGALLPLAGMLADFAVAGISMGAFFGLGVGFGGLLFLSGMGLIGYGLYSYYVKPESSKQQTAISPPTENDNDQVQRPRLKTTAELIAELNALPAAPKHMPMARKAAAINPQPAPQASVLKRFTNAVSSTFSGFFSVSRKSNPVPHREFSLRRTL